MCTVTSVSGSVLPGRQRAAQPKRGALKTICSSKREQWRCSASLPARRLPALELPAAPRRPDQGWGNADQIWLTTAWRTSEALYWPGVRALNARRGWDIKPRLCLSLCGWERIYFGHVREAAFTHRLKIHALSTHLRRRSNGNFKSCLPWAFVERWFESAISLKNLATCSWVGLSFVFAF